MAVIPIRQRARPVTQHPVKRMEGFLNGPSARVPSPRRNLKERCIQLSDGLHLLPESATKIAAIELFRRRGEGAEPLQKRRPSPPRDPVMRRSRRFARLRLRCARTKGGGAPIGCVKVHAQYLVVSWHIDLVRW